MNEKVNLDLKSLQFILNKNRAYIAPFFVFIASIFLFLQFVIPQFQSLLQAQDNLAQERLKLNNLQNDLNLLSNTDEVILNEQFDAMSKALPLDKDFGRMLNSIYYSASRTGVSLGNFSFKVGDLSTFSENEDIPTIKISIPITAASAFTIRNFLQSINDSLPLAKISLIKTGQSISVVDLDFYYKSIDSSVFNRNTRSVSQEGLDLIESLSGFEDTSSFSQETIISFE
jgi:Tfp pilus assembly protein PilO